MTIREDNDKKYIEDLKADLKRILFELMERGFNVKAYLQELTLL